MPDKAGILFSRMGDGGSTALWGQWCSGPFEMNNFIDAAQAEATARGGIVQVIVYVDFPPTPEETDAETRQAEDDANNDE